MANTVTVRKRKSQKHIQYRLGHKNIDITLNVYQHFTESSRIQGNERLNGMFLDT